MTRIFLITFLFLVQYAYGQQVELTGIVKNQTGEPISAVSILLKKEGNLKSFALTDQKGHYILKVTANDLAGSVLETSHLTYGTEHIQVVPNQFTYNFTLIFKDHKIQEISIGKPVPIRQRQDTLSFSVRAFADSTDRSIGDVLRRIPGFKVSESGKISFNGQDISNFFIDGDDVLGGRYGLGTRNIPHKIIAAFEIYRNHQAIKALADKVNSNQIALNLKVKEDANAQWLTEIKLGLGLPKQYVVEANVLQFNKKFKTVNALMANNIGVDLEFAMQNLTQKSPLDFEHYLFRTGNIQVTQETKDRFYKGQDLGSFFNLFFKIKKDWSVRTNVGLFFNKNYFFGQQIQQFELPEHTFETKETMDVLYKPLKTEMNVNLMRNMDKLYISNTSKFSFNIHRISDEIGSTELNLQEKLRQKTMILENKFSFIPNNKGKNIWRMDWTTAYKNAPERINILGDQNIPAIASYVKTNLVQQSLSNRSFNTNVDIYYNIQSINSFSQSYGVETSFENNKFQTELLVKQVGAVWNKLPAFQNNLHWNRYYIAAYGSYQFNKGKLKTNIKLPLGLQLMDYYDRQNALNEHRKPVLFTPSLRIKYELKPTQSILLDYYALQSYGQVYDVYRAYVLTDFRSIRKSNTHLPELFNNRIQVRYAIENPQKMRFWNFTYGISLLKSNILSAIDLNPDAIEINYTLDRNHQFTQELGLKFGQYLQFLRGTSSLEANYKINRANQLFNGIKQRIQTNNILLSPQLDWKMGDIQGRYAGIWSWSWTTFKRPDLPSYGHVLNHNVSLTYDIQSKVFLTASGTYVEAANANQKNRQTLINSNIRYKASKKVEYGLQVLNLLNQKRNSFFLMESGYSFYQENATRGRMVVLTAQMNF